MNKLSLLYEQLEEHLDLTYAVNQDKYGIVLITPYVNYIHDNINVYIDLDDDNQLIFNDNCNTIAEFDMSLKKIDFKHGRAKQILDNYDVTVSDKDVLMIKKDNRKMSLNNIIDCVHQLESAQLALMTLLLTMEN